MRSAPDTSYDEHGKAGSAPSYQWYTKIEVAWQKFRRTLVDWRQCNEELDWGFRNNLVENDLASQIARLNRMHREISEIDDLMRPNLQVPTLLDSGQDASSNTLCLLDPWARSRPPEGLSDEGLVVRRSSPLSRVQGRLASSTTPIARHRRYHST